jgi:hypothetical protein
MGGWTPVQEDQFASAWTPVQEETPYTAPTGTNRLASRRNAQAQPGISPAMRAADPTNQAVESVLKATPAIAAGIAAPEFLPALSPLTAFAAKPVAAGIGTGLGTLASGGTPGQALEAGGAMAATDLGFGAVGAGIKAFMPEAAPVALQMTKDAIKKVLGAGADADVVANAAARMEPQGIVAKHLSNVENELKLVKPKVDADLISNNKALDEALSPKNSMATVNDASHEVNKVFDGLISKAQSGVGDTDEAVKAINSVRGRVVSKLQDGVTPIKDVNDVKRLIGDEVKKFSVPDMLNSSQKQEQEAYRQAYFKLRDLVSTAEPATKELNDKISDDIELQHLLEKKFPHLETAEEAQTSHAGVVSANKKAAVKKAIIGAAIGIPAIREAGSVGSRMLH